MSLLSAQDRAALVRNGRKQRAVKGTAREIDFIPVVRLFTPYASAIWLLTELDPGDRDLAFGLCDLGQGFPELGSVRISELEALSADLVCRVERDEAFRPGKTLSQCARAARQAGRIVD